ncbi:putative nuclease HARBI1 [Diabrotica virgifera virgifera]|uniref:DDE Tnp4 domain-containing protein n=1 Tax=Diabrotica virgifera virgifera TaxID=50390 RepID=A0ABM5K691_DIAVI|nr:putative nuclease HARBI1 [Diabrotica virgifera virgifera]
MSDEEFSDMSSLSSMGSGDEDDLELLLDEPRVKNQNYLEHTVTQYSQEEFFEHFRLSRGTVDGLVERFEASQYYNSQEGQHATISALHQVLIYLWYIGHQTCSFRDVGDRFNITISSVHRIIHRMTYFLSNLSPDVIKWPNQNEKTISEQHFRANGFPDVIGAIDGSHIKIDKPENDPESYINRKGFYSIQMQLVCDHRRKITDIFIGYPGSVHDSRVFRNSPLHTNLEERCGRYFLLGDSGYPLQANLLTPYKDRGNLTRRQRNYNLKLAKNRYVVEHCFGILKQKFRQMYHVKLRNIRLICNMIRAACVLHNIAIDDNIFNIEPLNQNPPEQLHEINDDDDNVDDVGVRAIRDRVANTLQL